MSALVSNEGGLAELAQECAGNAQGRYNSKPRAVPANFPREDQLLYGRWEEPGYEGGFYLLWRGDDGNLYEQELSHCSCNSYSEDFNSWANLKPVTAEYLRLRAAPYTYGDESHIADFKALVAKL